MKFVRAEESNVHTILDMSERGYSAGAGAAAHVTWATQKLRIRKGCVLEPGEQKRWMVSMNLGTEIGFDK